MKVIKIVIIIIIINDDENINGNFNNNDNHSDNNNRKTHSSSEIWTGRCIRYPLSSKDATSRALKRGYGESSVIIIIKKTKHIFIILTRLYTSSPRNSATVTAINP